MREVEYKVPFTQPEFLLEPKTTVKAMFKKMKQNTQTS